MLDMMLCMSGHRHSGEGRCGARSNGAKMAPGTFYRENAGQWVSYDTAHCSRPRLNRTPTNTAALEDVRRTVTLVISKPAYSQLEHYFSHFSGMSFGLNVPGMPCGLIYLCQRPFQPGRSSEGRKEGLFIGVQDDRRSKSS